MKNEVGKFVAGYFGLSISEIGMMTKISDIAENDFEAINFSFDFEKKFNVEISEDEAMRLTRVRDFVRIVERKK
ncbi:MAG: hypothetical protein KKH61_20715 [Gammaproteobacteria bacterium]|nr:hypothetical protein [Gammaproteobacteria bacterium]